MNNLKELLTNIYAVTNDGLDIISTYCPAVRDVLATNPRKLFRYRPDERTPSAHLYHGDTCWYIIDFGRTGEGHSLSPLDVYMDARGYSQRDFTLAVLELAEAYGLHEQLSAHANRPLFEQRPARDDEPDGLSFTLRPTPITDDEARRWGRQVTPALLASLGWHPVSAVTRVSPPHMPGDGGTEPSARVATIRWATDSYPIFAERCPYTGTDGQDEVFWKLYEPLCPQKQYRFSIVGRKPARYLHGMDALRRAYHAADDKPLPAVLLVSGGSDAAAALAMGWQPVWRNSETEELHPDDYALLLHYARRIVNVPDLDETGLREGTRLALRYPDMATLWLPGSRMAHLHDNRGRQRKDLKDYVDVFPSLTDFGVLVHNARTARFWHTDKDRAGRERTTLSLTALAYFCQLNGWYREATMTGISHTLLRVDSHLVDAASMDDLRDFLRHYLDTQPLSLSARDTILRSPDLNVHLADCLEPLDLGIDDATRSTQCFYLQNGWVEVTAADIVLHSYDALPPGRHVWRKALLPYSYRPCKPMFEVTGSEDEGWHVRIHSTESKLMQFLIQTSRLHWRDELERPFAGDDQAAAAYAATHRFCLDGEGLTDEQIGEQMRCLANKLFACGYLLHSYKMESRAFACFALDYRISEVGQCNGRTGKSLFGKALTRLAGGICLDANRQEKADSRFFLAPVTAATRLVFIDECNRHFDIHDFFPHITDDMTVERKGVDPLVIPFARSPKMLLASNYALRADDSSTWARLLPVVFSDYYHEQTPTGGYRESRSVEDDLGCRLLSDDYDSWEADIAFLMQCVQFYLRTATTVRKLMPPMAHIRLRQQKATLGPRFEQWADEFFSTDNGHRDTQLRFDEVYASYERETHDLKLTKQLFSTKLKDYCLLHAYIYNPAAITGNVTDGGSWRPFADGKKTTCLFVQTAPPPQPPTQQHLDF